MSKSNSQFSRLYPVGLLIILLIAAGARFYRLDYQSFWNDEGNSARLSERSFDLIIEGTASDVHPPLYYLALNQWRQLVGESEFGLRSLSAFLGVVQVAATMTLTAVVGKFAIGPQQAQSWSAKFIVYAVGLAVALSPPLIYYAQEARMYSLLGALSTVSTLMLWRWLSGRSTSFELPIGYILLATAGLYTHYFFPTILIVHNLLVGFWVIGIWFNTQKWRPTWQLALRWSTMMIAVIVLYLPWFPIFLRMGSGGRPPGDEPPMTFLSSVGRWLIVGNSGETQVWLIWVIIAATAVAGLSSYLWQKQGRPSHHWMLLSAWLLVPLIFMLVVGATLESYHKFLTGVVPAVWILFGIGAMQLWQNSAMPIRLTAAGTLIALTVLATPQYRSSLHNLYDNPAYARADYRGIAQQITAEQYNGAGIILNAPNQWEVFTYYYQGDLPTYPIPRVRSDASVIAAELEEIAAAHSRLYAIFWGEGERDPERIVESWLDSHAFKAIDEWRGDIRFVMYALPDESMGGTLQYPLGATWGADTLYLDGYSISADQYRTGEVLQLSLFWRAPQKVEARYKVFIHVLDANGQLVAQRDSEPNGNLRPTNSWAAGETVLDNHGVLLPFDLPDGQYQVVVGLYDIADPAARLAIAIEDGQPMDALHLQTITVTR